MLCPCSCGAAAFFLDIEGLQWRSREKEVELVPAVRDVSCTALCLQACILPLCQKMRWVSLGSTGVPGLVGKQMFICPESLGGVAKCVLGGDCVADADRWYFALSCPASWELRVCFSSRVELEITG